MSRVDKGVSTSLRRYPVRPFGVVRREAFVKSTKQFFFGRRLWSVGAPMDQPEMISGPPTMDWCNKSIFGCKQSLGAKPIDEPAASSLCTETVFAYLVMKICRPCSGRLWPCGMLAVTESSLRWCIRHPQTGFYGETCTGQARRISSVSVITDEVQKRLLERLLNGYLGAYLWESGVRGQAVKNCLKAERRSEVAWLFLPCRIV